MRHLVPVSVSLVETKCPKRKPSNNLRVFHEIHESGLKQGFAVCSKGLSQLGDVSMRIIEWIELLRALGKPKNTFFSIMSQCLVGEGYSSPDWKSLDGYSFYFFIKGMQYFRSFEMYFTFLHFTGESNII